MGAFNGDQAFAEPPVPPPVGVLPATLNTGVVSFDGAGNVLLTNDSNELGTLYPDQLSTDTYSVLSNGKVTFGSGSSILYIMSPTRFVSMSTNPGDPNPKLGFGEQ